MSLTQINQDNQNSVEAAIDVLRRFEPPEGYYLSFSGGKDSIVIFDLAMKAGVKFDAHYNVTSIDPPELVTFIRANYGGLLTLEKPKENIWHLVERKGLPRRNARFCCEYLKEHTGANRLIITGIRHQESSRRAHRRMKEKSKQGRGKEFLHPIINWSSDDVWQYIRSNHLPYCQLYDEGYTRIGCVLCPMTSAAQAEKDAARWPKLAAAWYRAGERFYARGTPGTRRWPSWDDMWHWWLGRKAFPVDHGQGRLFD